MVLSSSSLWQYSTVQYVLEHYVTFDSKFWPIWLLLWAISSSIRPGMEGDIPSQGEEVSTSTNAPSLLQDRNSADIPSASENKTSNPGVETISPNASTLLNLDSSLGHEAQVEPIHERPNGENIAPLKGWPISPMPFRKSWTATILEHCTYLLMGICSAMFLGKNLHFCARSYWHNVSVCYFGS